MSIQDWKAPSHSAAPHAATDWSKIYPMPEAGSEASQPQAPSSPETDYANMPAGEVASRAMSAAPGSLMKAGEGLYNVVKHPLDTLYNIGELENGAIGNVANAFGYHGLDEPEAQAAASAVGKSYADRYGSMAGFKKAIATDPVSVGLDVASIAPGIGAAGKLAGLEKITGPVESLARLGDPIHLASKAASIPAGIAMKAVKTSAAKASGIPGNMLGDIYNVGANPDASARSAYKAQLGGEDAIKNVEVAKAAVDEKYKNMLSNYVSSRSNLTTQNLGKQPILDTIDHSIASLGSDAAIHFPDTVDLLNRMKDVLNQTTG